jgi:hypothetical protein
MPDALEEERGQVKVWMYIAPVLGLRTLVIQGDDDNSVFEVKKGIRASAPIWRGSSLRDRLIIYNP